MTDASFQAAVYAVLIEGDRNQKYASTRKTYAPIAYGSKTHTLSQIKMSVYEKEFLANYLAFKKFRHVFWGATKPVIFMRQQLSHHILANKNDSSILTECLRLCIAI